MCRSIKDANAKLLRLCYAASQAEGQLTTFAAVARAMGIAPSTVTRMFGVGDASAEKGLNPENLAKLVTAFKKDGVELAVDDLYLPLAAFYARFGGRGTAWRSETEPSPLPASDWVVEDSRAPTPLASVTLHPPYPVNDRPGCYRLAATPLFSHKDYFDEGEAPLRVGLREASLAIESDGYQFADASLAGSKARPLPGVSVGAHGVLTLTAAEGGMLRGNPLDEQELAVIEPKAGADAAGVVDVMLTAPPFGFTAVLLDPETGVEQPTPAAGVTKARIIALVYAQAQAEHRDAAGMLRLARARVRRVAGE